MPRYHLTLGNRRTTASLDNILAEYLALKLGYAPDAEGAHGAVREWLQAQLDELDDPGRSRVSQWLQAQVVEAIADKKLSEARGRWLLSDLDAERTAADDNLDMFADTDVSEATEAQEPVPEPQATETEAQDAPAEPQQKVAQAGQKPTKRGGGINGLEYQKSPNGGYTVLVYGEVAGSVAKHRGKWQASPAGMASGVRLYDGKTRDQAAIAMLSNEGWHR